MKKVIALLCGGISSEREVSLKSGQQVRQTLDPAKYDVHTYDPKTDLPLLVKDAPQIDAALILLHGAYGEDGTIQGLLELLDIPYQGAGVLGSALAMNKLAAKRVYESCGIPIPAYVAVKRSDKMEKQRWITQLGLPLVVKPVIGGSSIGMTIVRGPEQLEGAMEKAFEQDHTILVESYIQGIEITGGVLGNDPLEALPLIEIIPDPKHEFFDYEAKYTAGVTQEICPARIDTAVAGTAQDYARMAHRALFCMGYSRTDMIVRGEEVFVLETNTIPGMTPTSLFPQAAQVAGYSFGQLLDRLIELGMQAHRKR